MECKHVFLQQQQQQQQQQQHCIKMFLFSHPAKRSGYFMYHQV